MGFTKELSAFRPQQRHGGEPLFSFLPDHGAWPSSELLELRLEARGCGYLSLEVTFDEAKWLHAVRRFGLTLSRPISEVHSCSCSLFPRINAYVVVCCSCLFCCFHFCSAFVLIQIFLIQNLILVVKSINTIRSLKLVAKSINNITRQNRKENLPCV